MNDNPSEEAEEPQKNNTNRLLIIFTIIFAIVGIPGGILVNRYIQARNARNAANLDQIDFGQAKECACLDQYNFGKNINIQANQNDNCTVSCQKQGYSCPIGGCLEATGELVDENGCKQVCNEECKRSDNCEGFGSQIGHCGWTKTKPVIEKKWCRVCETVCPEISHVYEQIQEDNPGQQVGENQTLP